MFKLDSNITTVSPAWLIISTVVLLMLRVFLISCELRNPVHSSWRVDWHEPSPVNGAARPDGKLTLYYFTAAWCGTCRALEKNVFENRDMAEYINKQFHAEKVADRSMEDRVNQPVVEALEDKYKITLFPTVVVALSNGVIVAETSTQTTLGQMRKFLHDAVEDSSYYLARDYFCRHDFAKADKAFNSYIETHDWSNRHVIYSALRRYVALRFLKNDSEAAALLQIVKKRADPQKWPFPIFSYFANDLSYEALLNKAGDGRDHRIEVRSYVGSVKTLGADKENARKDLEWVAAQVDVSDWPERKLALFALETLKPGSVQPPEPGRSEVDKQPLLRSPGTKKSSLSPN